MLYLKCVMSAETAHQFMGVLFLVFILKVRAVIHEDSMWCLFVAAGISFLPHNDAFDSV